MFARGARNFLRLKPYYPTVPLRMRSVPLKTYSTATRLRKPPTSHKTHPAYPAVTPRRNISYSLWDVFSGVKKFLFGSQPESQPESKPVQTPALKPVNFVTVYEALHEHQPSILKGEKRSHHHVQEDTAQRVFEEKYLQSLRDHAQANLKHWAADCKPSPQRVEVFKEDWGDVAQRMTERHGKIYAVLNMANASYVGGDFMRGGSAQEENMFARTTCLRHVVTEETLDVYFDEENILRYKRAMTDLINAQTSMTPAERLRLSEIYGRAIPYAYKVYMDANQAEVCFRGPERFVPITESATFDDSFGHRYIPMDGAFSELNENQMFPFYELRAAALDLTDCNLKVDWENEEFLKWFRTETKQRIDAQLDTAILNKVRNLILCPFGCGAFKNRSDEVAKLYRQALEERAVHFDHVVFVAYYAGHGVDNFPAFAKELEGLPLGQAAKPAEKNQPQELAKVAKP